MRFAIFADSSCNLPKKYQEQFAVTVMPFSYEMDGVLYPCPQNPEEMDGKQYYDYLRNKGLVKTSLIPVGQIMDAFRPVLEAGQDILYIALSSGVSGTYGSAVQAMHLLEEDFPDRNIQIFDSLGAGLGAGVLVGLAHDYREAGKSLSETVSALEADREHLCQFFTVDDLMFLKRTGRVSGVAATLGTMLQLKPLLRGDETGHIVVMSKARGRKKAIDTLAELYRDHARNPEAQRVFISHGDCLPDAEALAAKIRSIAAPKELSICVHEPLTGAHSGPGMLALFFLGDHR